MFKQMNLIEVINAGGITMYILIACSVLSIAVIIERLIYFKRRQTLSRVELMDVLKKDIIKGQIMTAIGFCRNNDSPFAKVALAGLTHHQSDEKVITNAMEREITIETIKFERFTSIIGTIGGIAVYIGLFGTVLGIMAAFNDIGQLGTGSGMDVVTKGIAEALVCTATGLLVAIPAVVSFNYFSRSIDNGVLEMELTASELSDLLMKKSL